MIKLLFIFKLIEKYIVIHIVKLNLVLQIKLKKTMILFLLT